MFVAIPCSYQIPYKLFGKNIQKSMITLKWAGIQNPVDGTSTNAIL